MEHTRFNQIVPVDNEGTTEIVESDVIQASITEWEESPESQTGAWSVSVDLETGRVLANRLLGVPVIHLPATSASAIGL